MSNNKEEIPHFDDTEPVFDETQELDAVPPLSVGQGEAGLIGLQQGGTVGTSDELAGAIQAGLNLLPGSPVEQAKELQAQGFTGDIGPTSVLDQYRQARDEERKRIESAREQHPGTMFAGELAGGLLTAAAMPTGFPTSVGKIPSALVNPELMAMGAAAGLGTSKADLTKGEVGEAAMDTGAGMLGAQLVGGIAIPSAVATAKTVGRGTKAVGEKIKNTQAVQDLLDAYRASKAGQKISGQTDKLTQKINKSAEDLYGALQEAAGKATSKRTSALKANEAKSVNLKDTLRQIRSEAEVMPARNDAEKQAKKTILSLLDENFSKQSADKLTPEQANDVIQAIKKYSPMGDKAIQDSDFANLALKAARQSEEELGKAVPIQQLNKDISSNLAMSEALAKENPFEQIKLGEAPDVIQGISNKLQKLASEPKVRVGTEELVSKGFKNPKSGTEVPSLKDLNPEAANIMESAKKTSRLLDLAKKSEKGSPMQLGAVKTGELAGQAVTSGKEFVTKGARKLSDMTPDNMKNLANLGVQKFGKGFEPYAKIIDNIIQNKSDVSRNAAIFSLMQRPDFREMMREMMNQPEETPNE
jgi:uncharacterized protein with von Willebrand factor type A (vWA) domain